MWDDYEKMAEEAAGNWKKFDSFCWHDEPARSEDWCLVYTHNRDSGLLDQSNAAAIDKELEPYMGRTVHREHHGHWGVGWVDGYAICVRTKRGKITRAFKAWCDLQGSLQDYACLDESDLSQREYDETIENIGEVVARAWNKVDGGCVDLPNDSSEQLYKWFSTNKPRAIECRDGGGGYPSEEECQAAFLDLEWVQDCPECGLVDFAHAHCANCQDAYDTSKGGVVHPIEGTRFCCNSCYLDGYTLKAV